MGLIRKVNGRAVHSIVQERVTRGQQSGHVGDRAAANEKAAGCFGKSAPLPKPFDDLEFHRGRGGATEPCPIKDIESGGERICHRAHEIVRAGNERKKTRMVDVKVVRENLPLQSGQELLRIGRAIAWEPGKHFMQCFAVELGSDGVCRHFGETFRKQVDHGIAEGAHFIGRQLQPRGIALHHTMAESRRCNLPVIGRAASSWPRDSGSRRKHRAAPPPRCAGDPHSLG